MTSPLMMRRRAMGAPVAAALVSDTFTRVDSTTLGNAETGQAWTVMLGSFAVQTGAAKSGGDGVSEQIAWVNAASVIGAVEAKVTASATKDDGILARHNGGADMGAVDFYLWRISGAAVELYRRSGGTWTLLASFAFSATTGTAYVLRLTLVGSTIKGFLDGVERASVTDTTVPDTNTRAGMRLGFADARLDDFKVTAP